MFMNAAEREEERVWARGERVADGEVDCADRVAVYVDYNNIFNNIDSVMGYPICPKKLLRLVVGDGNLEINKKFGSPGLFGLGLPDDDDSDFEGFTKCKCDRKLGTNGEKGNDVNLSLSSQRAVMSGRIQRNVIVSGDGDFIPLVALGSEHYVYTDIYTWRHASSYEGDFFHRSVFFENLSAEQRSMIKIFYLDDYENVLRKGDPETWKESFAKANLCLNSDRKTSITSPSRKSPYASPTSTAAVWDYAQEIALPPSAARAPPEDCCFGYTCRYAATCKSFHPPAQRAFLVDYKERNGNSVIPKNLKNVTLCTNKKIHCKDTCSFAQSYKDLTCIWCTQKGHSPSFFEKTSKCPREDMNY